MEYIIGIILLVIVLLIIGLILRKRIYDNVDKHESWKLDIMGRDIASQLSRIKALNLSGETQERFETWKDRWETIITKQLPDIEEYLLDAEEAADKFRIKKAKQILNNAENALQSIEQDIEQLLSGLEDLLESEETSRKEVEEIEPTVKSLRKILSQNRYQYGKAERHFELEIDGLEEAFAKYHELADSGNYFEAKEMVLNIKVDMEDLEEQIDKYPAIYKKCKHDLPTQLDSIYSGIREMKEEGYRVEHLAFEKEIRAFQTKLSNLMEILEKGEIEEPERVLIEVEERISEMYQFLEKEAIAKKFLETNFPSFQDSIHNVSERYDVTKNEVEELRKAYFFEDADMEKYLSLGKDINAIQEQLKEITAGMDDKQTAHSELRNRIDSGYEKINQLKEDLEEFKGSIHNLRKDELEARDQLEEMGKQLYNLDRKLKKSNIPGVPTFIWNSIEDTTNKNSKVIEALARKPLDMTSVQQTLNEAKFALDQTMEQTNVMLDQAFLTEQVIQYANRYRSKYPLLAAQLLESERLFRSYEYELALETAAKAVEEVEPGALKRIEENQTLIYN